MRVNAIDGFHEDVEHLRASLDASSVVGTWDWDHVRGVVVYDAGAARLLTGDSDLADCEISGAIAAAAVHPLDQEWLADHMKRAAKAGGLVLAEYRVLAENGSVRWLLNRGRSHLDPVGRPIRSRGILIDITEMRDGGERYVLNKAPVAREPLIHAADLAISLKHALGDDAPSEVLLAANLLLFSLGRAIGRL
ncbi:PAS domain-containing protein [Methylobacterium sp. WL103]|uniref:PAS domain-containing protein n=1 Tax=Methylobacterium sp. WL103 TaxID=2603891 RepID=UPI0011C70149|nr:PAS domain-containing protein [Methylobacterium sp. WL103]TXN04583.1 PAS domain-containing protein [Methylobacterium sp. WL103]